MKRTVSFLFCLIFVFAAFFTDGNVAFGAEEYKAATPITEAEVLKKIDTLAELLEGKYFTTKGTSCWNNSCTRCLNVNVFNSKWFKNLFGNVSVNQIPGHAYPRGNTGYAFGWSCHGFANFAMWYIFASDNTEKVEYKTVADYITCTQENIEKYARPGDVIRYQRSSSSGHSAVFISADENGITVLDNNAKIDNDGYNRVRVRVVKYNDLPMAISRATNYIDTPTLTVNFNANGGTVPGSVLKGYAYRVTNKYGDKLRTGAGSGFKRLTTIPMDTVFTVDLNATVEADGYVWGKTTYGKYTGWVIISKYVKKLGEVMNTSCYVKEGIVYSSITAEPFSQKFLYNGTKIGFVDNTTLGIVNGDSKFLGWSLTPDGKDIIKRGASLLPDDIAKSVNYESTEVTLFAVWESTHIHSYAEWLYNGNENNHSAFCSCGATAIEDHKWVEDHSDNEDEKIYHCEGCQINKTVSLMDGSYSVGGVTYHIEDKELGHGWFVVNGNKIINFGPIWRNNF